jgi:hypothetical protein
MEKEHLEDKMDESARRSESTVRDKHDDSISTDFEKREEVEQEIDEEKTIGLDDIGAVKSNHERDIQEEDANRLAPAKSVRSIHSHRSYAAGDGYTCFNADEERPNISSGGTADEYLVGWDGDADPMNPRSMSKLRRWTIVCIVSASSLCV